MVKLILKYDGDLYLVCTELSVTDSQTYKLTNIPTHKLTNNVALYFRHHIPCNNKVQLKFPKFDQIREVINFV